MFIVFGWVSLMLTSSSRTVRKKGSVPKMENPPPPPKKVKLEACMKDAEEAKLAYEIRKK